MKERIGIALVLLLSLFGLVPPLFAEGGTFNFMELYYDNVYFTLLYLFLAFFGISMPFILPKMSIVIRTIYSMFGAWFFAAFLFEVLNFKIPEEVLNSDANRTLFTKFLIAVIVGLSISMVRETWQKSQK